jgi:nucleotide-binding universal stress UspA family protein
MVPEEVAVRPFKKILVPLSPSPSCSWSAEYARHLVGWFGAELIFVHVRGYDPPDAAEAFLAKTVGPSDQLILLDGDPAECVVRTAEEQAADVILMPTRARGRFRRFLLGSVTAKVLHDTACPVWTGIHSEDRPFPMPAKFSHILCAVDTDAGCIKEIGLGRYLARQFGAEVSLAHAIPAADETSQNRGEIEVRRLLFREAEQKFAAIFQEAGIDEVVSIAGGPVTQVVREAALAEGAELVVIGRGHTRAGLGRLRTDSYGIIRSAPCPVLSV